MRSTRCMVGEWEHISNQKYWNKFGGGIRRRVMGASMNVHVMLRVHGGPWGAQRARA
jgi:hypothetical protein